MRRLTPTVLAGLLLATAAGAADLSSIARSLAARPAWQAEFTQRYTPAGFDTGTEDGGTVVLASPDRLRFDYPGRVFAVDGLVARLVDSGAGSCDAFRLDEKEWGRMPLAALLDPGAASGYFHQSSHAEDLVLKPIEPNPEIGSITISVDAQGLPVSLVLVDESGNTNAFSFRGWHALDEAPSLESFRPSIDGKPCAPERG